MANLNSQQKVEMMYALAKQGDGWRCRYCHVRLIPRGQEGVFCIVSYVQRNGEEALSKILTPPTGYSWPTLDHKVPRANGGSDDIENLALCCKQCNGKKSHRITHEDFYELMAPARERERLGADA